MSFEQGFEDYLSQSGLEKSAQHVLREVLATTEPEVLAAGLEEWEKSADMPPSIKDFPHMGMSGVNWTNVGLAAGGSGIVGGVLGGLVGAGTEKNPEESRTGVVLRNALKGGVLGAGLGAGANVLDGYMRPDYSNLRSELISRSGV